MQLARFRRADGSAGYGAVVADAVRPFRWPATLGDLLAAPDAEAAARLALDRAGPPNRSPPSPCCRRWTTRRCGPPA